MAGPPRETSPLTNGERLARPTATVVVLNWNGEEHLRPVFRSLEAQDWPAERLELLCVDNGSTDGSLALLAAEFPGVRVEALDANLGFAGGCNAGARAATGEILCFINNDMRADPGWVRHLVTPLGVNPGLGATGGKVLDWEGKNVDFAGAVMNFEGRGGQIGFGEPYDPRLHDQGRQLLFVNGGCMAIRRERFLDVGGFDDDFFAFYEDVDLGWRLNLYGFPVRYVPEAVTYHRHHGTSKNVPAGKLRVLYERNAFLSAIKNYQQANLARVLAPAYMLAVKRGYLDAGIDAAAFGVNRPERVEDLVPQPEAVATLTALEEINRLLPAMLAKRAEVQRRRVRSDASLGPLFGEPFLVARPEAEYGRLQGEVQALFGVEEVFQTMRPKVLVISGEVISSRMAGPGIRAVEMCKVLAQEADVTLAVDSPTDLAAAEFDILQVTPKQMGALAAKADVIVASGLTLASFSFLASMRAPVVVDAYDPFTIALLEQGRDKPMKDRVEDERWIRSNSNRQLELGDFFLCATDRQWAMLVGGLQTLGRITPALYDRDPTLRSFVARAPFGLSSTPPAHGAKPVMRGVLPGVGADDLILLWAGGIYNWFDPETLIRAVGRVVGTHPEVKLVFFGGKHPNPAVPAMRAAADARRVAKIEGLTDSHVFFLSDWVPYEERGAYLLEADVGVSTHRDHAESSFAFRTRFLDYLWAGLPVICSAGDALGELSGARGFGEVVPPENVDALAAAIARVAADTGLREQMAKASRETAADFTWEQVLAPLVEFVRSPRPAPDRPRAESGKDRQPAYGTVAWRASRLRQYWTDHGTVNTGRLVGRKLIGR